MSNKPSDTDFIELTADEIDWSLPDGLDIGDASVSSDVPHAIVGQDRAMKALRLGLELYAPGYNVFVCGVTGSGRMTTVKRMMAELQPSCALANDLCYVNNFKNPDAPMLLELHRGTASKFRKDVNARIAELEEEISTLINSDEARERQAEIEAPFRKKTAELAGEFAKNVAPHGFRVTPIQSGITLLPELIFESDGHAIPLSKLDALVETGEVAPPLAAKVYEAYESIRGMIASFMAEQGELRRKCHTAVEQAERSSVRLAISSTLNGLRSLYPDEHIGKWLDQVSETLVENLQVFRRPIDVADDEEPDGPDMSAFDVNIILTSSNESCPNVIENNPTWSNLFGSQDKVMVAPNVYGTDFSRIKPGSLVKAQGGYLILNARDVMAEPGVWEHLKRVLRSGELVIQPSEKTPQPGVPVLNPDPIPVTVKVVMVGNSDIYHTLHEMDDDFAKIFKVKADFDTRIDIDEAAIGPYIGVLLKIIQEEELLPFDREAIGAVVRQAMRVGGRRDRLTTRFSLLADVLREASYIAQREQAERVGKPHVTRSLIEMRERRDLVEERMRRQICDGDVLVETDGSRVGQVNGLTVLSTGDYEFGMPARITCRTAAGRAGVINLEREVEMSGSTHDKGVLILQGFMVGRYAQKHPLTLTASLCFEQSYAWIDGDSASSAEAYVMMSSLSGLPLRQDLAVTGAIDQFGNVQPVGGVTEKVEGFFRVCARRGLNGKQGVLIPRRNVGDLMPEPDLLDAIRDGRFHVYPIDHVDQGIELLTGVLAGQRENGDRWPPGTVNRLVQERIDELHASSHTED